MLESRAHAEGRRAKILARLLGHANTFARRETKTACSPVAIQRSIELALQRAGVTAGELGHVNAHGLSDTEADRHEARAIRAALGDTPVLALKSYFGNLGAGGAPVELAASVLSFSAGWAPPSLNYDQPDPECQVNVVAGEPLEGARPLAIKLAQSPMGQAAAVVVAGP